MYVWYVDVQQERSHNALIADVENFQSSSLKRTDTKEKIVLPNAQGKIATKFDTMGLWMTYSSDL